MSTCNAYYRFFSNLSNKTRFNIVMALKDSCLSVGELAQKIDEEQSNVSHQLKKLVGCSIVSVQRDGKKHVYSLNKQTILPILEIIKTHVKTNCSGCCPQEKIIVRKKP